MDGNPILTMVDAGHYVCTAKGNTCRVCGTSMPCAVILAARAQNARRLAARSRAVLTRLGGLR